MVVVFRGKIYTSYNPRGYCLPEAVTPLPQAHRESIPDHNMEPAGGVSLWFCLFVLFFKLNLLLSFKFLFRVLWVFRVHVCLCTM